MLLGGWLAGPASSAAPAPLGLRSARPASHLTAPPNVGLRCRFSRARFALPDLLRYRSHFTLAAAPFPIRATMAPTLRAPALPASLALIFQPSARHLTTTRSRRTLLDPTKLRDPAQCRETSAKTM